MDKYSNALHKIKSALGESCADDLATVEAALVELDKLKRTLSRSKQVNDVQAGDRVGYAYIAKNSKVLYLCEERHAGLPHVFPIYRG